jgi:hypothetical protein
MKKIICSLIMMCVSCVLYAYVHDTAYRAVLLDKEDHKHRTVKLTFLAKIAGDRDTTIIVFTKRSRMYQKGEIYFILPHKHKEERVIQERVVNAVTIRRQKSNTIK